MDIQSVLDLLGGEGRRNIALWRDWWLGEYRPFHRYRERNAAGGVIERPIYSMRMAKKICEDWAAILLGEQPKLIIPHEPSRLFLTGEDGCGGVLGACRFWQRAAVAVEQAFYSGTGAFLLRLGGLRAGDGGRIVPDEAVRLGVECLPAMNIVPLTVRDGEITEAAFCSEVLCRGKRALYLETHTLENGGYVVENRCFAAEGALREIDPPDGVARRIVTGSAAPLFAILRPGGVASGMPEGMGEAVFAQAIDNLKGVDLAFHNFCRDFLLGGKKVFYNRSLLAEDESGALLAPDDVCQQLFLAVGDKLPGESQLIYEHNPALRVQDNISGIQAQLDYLSLKCGLGAKHYRFDAPTVTATQYVGDRQELVRNAARHGVPLVNALCGALRMLLWAGRAVCGAHADENCGVCVHLDDSVIADRESQRERDRADVAAGLLLPHEYRMRWYGESREAALAALAAQISTKEVFPCN